MEKPGRVVIVGGGIAGLCAGAGLAQAGIGALVLERNGYSVGGRVATYPPTSFEWQGRTWTFTLEHGVHGWWRQYRNFLGLIEECGQSGRMIDAFDQALIFLDGRNVYRTNVGRETQITPVPEPLHHGHLLLKKNIRRLIRTREIPQLWTLWMRILESVTFDPWDQAHRGRYDGMAITEYQRGVPFFYQAFVRSLSRSGFFSDPDEVSLWAYLVALQLYVFLRRSDQRYAFARGPIVRDLLDPLVARIQGAGGRVARGMDVDRVERAPGGGWRVHALGGEGSPEDLAGEQWIDASDLVLAVDVEGGKRILAGSPDLAPAYGDLSVFRGRKATTVRLWFSRSPTEEWGESGVFSGKCISDNFFWLHRFQDEFLQWHLETGGSVAECHLYAPAWKHEATDEVLIDRTLKDIEAGFPEIKGSLLHAAIVRNAGTHINFPVGCAQAFPKVHPPVPDLALCGDWIDGGTPVLYMERACQTGLSAANVVRARYGLPVRELKVPLPPPPHMMAIQRALRAVDRAMPIRGFTRPGHGELKDEPT